MEDALAGVEQGLLARLHSIEKLRCALAQRQLELEFGRRVLRERLLVIADTRDGTDDASLRGPCAPSSTASMSSSVTVAQSTPKTNHSADAMFTDMSPFHVKQPAEMPTHTFDAPRMPLSVASSSPSSVLSLSLWPPSSALPHLPPADFSPQTRETKAQSARHRQRCFVHAAKLQFSEEWARVALPWFDRVVHRQFLSPLMRRLESLEGRLAHLCTRLSLDLPQYALRRSCLPHEQPLGATHSMPVLWGRYLSTATQEPAEAPSPLWKLEEDQSAATLSSTALREREEEEVVLIPHVRCDNTALRESLLTTRRSLRHVWYVMRYGLLEGGRCLGEAPQMPCPARAWLDSECGSGSAEDDAAASSFQKSTNLCSSIASPCRDACGQEINQSASLTCQIEELMRRYATLALCFHDTQDNHRKGMGSPALKHADYDLDSTECLSQAVHCLLHFVHHLRALHNATGADHRSAVQQHAIAAHLPTPAARACTQATDAVPADVTALHAHERPQLLLEHLSLPSLQGLQGFLQPLLAAPVETATDATIEKDPPDTRDGGAEAAEGDTARVRGPVQVLSLWTTSTHSAAPLEVSADVVAAYRHRISLVRQDVESLLQWWHSASSCACRCVYARLLRLARLSSVGTQDQRMTRSADEQMGEMAPSCTSPPLAAEARLYRLHSAEMEVRGQWHEMHTRLLVARSCAPPPDSEE